MCLDESMIFTPKLVALPLAASALLLTGCSVNAPIQVPVDIHDNVVNNGPQGSGSMPEMPTQEEWDQMFPSDDPNAEQDTPDAWSEDSVDTPEPVPLPTPQG
jgi:hypothetical protein